MDAGVWRYHPVRHVFEVFTEGGSNPWGIDFDESGQLFAEMCVIPHFWHMIQGARIEREGGEHFCMNRDETARNEQSRDPRSRKPIYPFVYQDIKQHGDHVHWAGSRGPHAANARSDAAGGGHANAGVMCYLGASWPEEYRGNLYIGNIHGQRLNMDIPERQGSGYVGHHGKDFLNFNDSWSQTLNQLYDQDGSVYIIDWYDQNQCHNTREDGHDRSNGRIYKIVYNEQKTTKVDLQKPGDEGPARVSESARHILKQMSTAAGSDRSPWVRRQIASVLQRIPVEHRWEALTQLVQHAEDSTDHNLPLMYWYAAEPCVASDPAKAVALLEQCKIPLLREFIARRLATSSLKTVANK